MALEGFSFWPRYLIRIVAGSGIWPQFCGSCVGATVGCYGIWPKLCVSWGMKDSGLKDHIMDVG